MITSQGMLVCSFNLKQRFSRGEENVYPLNQQYELKLENETFHYKIKNCDYHIISYLKFVIEDLKEIHKQK